MHVDDYAPEYANNHASFRSFGWRSRPEDSENWTIVYTSGRDASILDQSNHAVFEKALDPWVGGDVVPERHGHWACGHVDGFAIRVYDAEGNVTDAFRAFMELECARENYPVLDDEDYSQRQHDAICEHWEGETLQGRIDLCKEAKISVFAARREDIPGKVYDSLRDSPEFF